MNWTYRVDDHTAGTALDDDLGLGLDGVAVVRVEQDAVVACYALVFVAEEGESGKRSRRGVLVGERHASEMNVDASAGRDTACPGLAHEFGGGALVV